MGKPTPNKKTKPAPKPDPRLPAEVSAALRAAGSAALPLPARVELDCRVKAYGYDAGRIGGVRSGARGAQGALATFPDLATAAMRLVQLCRIATGEHPVDAAQGYDPDTNAHLDMGAFVSLAPEAGADPMRVVHWSKLMPGDKSGDPGTPGFEMGAVRGRPGPRPSAFHVLAARRRRPFPRRPMLPAGPTCVDFPIAEQPVIIIEHEQPVFIEEDDADLDAVEGLWSSLWGKDTNSAAEHAFQDLTASWSAIRRVPGVEKVPGFKGNIAAWQEFSRAYQAGDNASPQCNGDCEAGLNAQIVTLQGMRNDLTKMFPDWIKSIPFPKQIGLAAAKGAVFKAAEAVDEAAKKIETHVPLVGWWVKLWSGALPGWQYAGIAVGGLAVGAVAVRAVLPVSRRSE